MPLPPDEPDSPSAIAAWVAEAAQTRDPFLPVRDASDAHRETHGADCTVYPTEDAPLLGLLTAASGASRILETGCGLGYSALWLARGARRTCQLQTVEQDPSHAELAKQHFVLYGYEDRIRILDGRTADVLPTLAGPYDVAFFDSNPAGCLADLEEFHRLVRPGGLLISANLFLGQYDDQISGLDEAAEYRRRLFDEERWLTAFLPQGEALSVRQSHQ